jgi:hypothetical protein
MESTVPSERFMAPRNIADERNVSLGTTDAMRWDTLPTGRAGGHP